MIKLEDFGIPKTDEGRALRRLLMRLINGGPSAKKDDLMHLLSVANGYLTPIEEVAKAHTKESLTALSYKELSKLASGLNIKRGKAEDMITALLEGTNNG